MPEDADASTGLERIFEEWVCSQGDTVWQSLPNLDDAQAKKKLLDMKGIGEKVANCHRYVERTGDSIEVCSCYQDWLLPVTAAAPAHLTLEMECVLWPKEYATDKFIAVTGSHAVDIHRRGDVYIFWCDAKEFQAVWAPYFDLDTDYKGFKSKMSSRPKRRPEHLRSWPSPYYEDSQRPCRTYPNRLGNTAQGIRALSHTALRACETKIVSMMGEVESQYYHRYSDLTGYLWTDEAFKCGGHDESFPYLSPPMRSFIIRYSFPLKENLVGDSRSARSVHN